MSRSCAVAFACSCGLVTMAQLRPVEAIAARKAWTSLLTVMQGLAPERQAALLGFFREHEAKQHTVTLGLLLFEVDPQCPMPTEAPSSPPSGDPPS